MEDSSPSSENFSSSRTAYKVILLLGLVSLFGDIVYEGARGLIPGFFLYLGASATIVGLVTGLGELVGYTGRLAGGFLADLSKRYWLFIFVGYGLIAALPSMPVSLIVGGWILAASLIILERFGKGFRAPARDAIIASVSSKIGRGKAFGIHEFFDQLGAITGPLLVAGLMALTQENYVVAFTSLFLPYFVLITVLSLAYFSIRGIKAKSSKKYSIRGPISRSLAMYTTGVFLNSLGLIPASLILYRAGLIAKGYEWLIPAVYALIQLIDAPSALAAGFAYDKRGISVLYVPFFLSIVISPLLFTGETLPVVLATAVLYGIVLGMIESTYRAAIADLAPPKYRGTAYGVFYTALGLGSLLSGAIYGLMIDLDFTIWQVAVYAILTEVLASILLTLTIKSLRQSSGNTPV
ncbi:MAG: MFS transporter [Thermoprotei archaeon]|nr:MAG: MFS transporter [Thermoprotei archaeon]